MPASPYPILMFADVGCDFAVWGEIHEPTATGLPRRVDDAPGDSVGQWLLGGDHAVGAHQVTGADDEVGVERAHGLEDPVTAA